MVNKFVERQPPVSLPVVVAVTGASGAPYAVSLLEELGRAGVPVDLMASRMGRDMLHREARLPARGNLLEHLSQGGVPTAGFRLLENRNLAASPASGSYQTRAMVICPCSVKTLSAVATGSCRTLIERAAEVTLKERRKLVLVLRETPYSLTTIDNMRQATLAGAVILPASPAFYHQPKGIPELVQFVVARILDQLGVPHRLIAPWHGEG